VKTSESCMVVIERNNHQMSESQDFYTFESHTYRKNPGQNIGMIVIVPRSHKIFLRCYKFGSVSKGLYKFKFLLLL
jgi:hypothetical protein